MKDRNRYFLKDAVVLMIVAAMVLTVIPAATAINNENKVGGTAFKTIVPYEKSKYDVCRPLPKQTPNMGIGGVAADAWIQYDDGTTENGLGLTSGGTITEAIELTDTELAAYRAYDITELYVSFGSDSYGAVACTYSVWIENSLPADPYASGLNIVATGSSSGTTVWNTIDVTDTPIPATGNVYIGINVNHAAGVFPLGFDTDITSFTRGALLTYQGYGTWTDLMTIGYSGEWGMHIGVTQGTAPPGQCLPDQCDFQLVSINNVMPGPINSFPQKINVTIRNNGEVGIAELKLLADVYQKVCGPTSTICSEKVYDLCNWETQAANDWSWTDDGDGDTWVLQGGAGNRWLTGDQAWRNTKGSARSYGGDENVYLGLSPGAVGYDTLIWHCADSNDISGAACATFKFSDWCQGEYYVDCNGNTIPVDYGTIAYSLDGGLTWTNVSISDFVSFDTNGAWRTNTIKFINTGVYNETAYADVCSDCTPAAGDIVVYTAFPDVAKLQVKFVWHKDVCDNFEEWYIDAPSLTRTEMYDLVLVHQTHDIIELPPCVGTPVNIYYEFPLGFDPENNTWYQLCVYGQVFDCPDCCEQIFDNNQKCIQFKVIDIHDMACVGNEILNPQPYWNVGDQICVNMTVQNKGTFAEQNVPVQLKVGKQILDQAKVDNFETNPMNNWDFYYFTGSSSKNYFRWTQGDSTISNIGDGRSVLPGDESMICADIGYQYPTLPAGAGCGMADPNKYDLSNVVSANLNFYAKWSIPPNQDCNGDGYVDSFWGIMVHPTSGPDSQYWWFAGGTAYMNYQNNWQYFTIDMKAEAANHKYTDTTGRTVIPEVEYMFGAFMCGQNGVIVPPANPIPWSGLMIDNVQFNIITCGQMTVVDTQYTGALSPGQKESLTLCWNDAQLCNWCLCKQVNLPGDVDHTNDVCCDANVKVRNSYPLTDWKAVDLTDTGAPCLWHICCTRSCDGTCCAWAGIQDATSGHYVKDMDDSLISPWYSIDPALYPIGVSLNLTSWWAFYAGDKGDFGQVYIRNSTTGAWILLGKVTDNSSGFYKVLSYYIPAKDYTSGSIQIRLRMVSDSNDCVAEGWYVCKVDIVEVLKLKTSPAPGETWYGFDAIANNPISFVGPEAPGTFTVLGPNTITSGFWSAGAWVGPANAWYVSGYYSTGALYTADTTDGSTTLVGGSAAYSYMGMAYDDVTSTLYGVTWTGSAAELYAIDYTSGTSTLLGNLGYYLFIDIACGPDGTLYGNDIISDSIYIITPPGTVTLLGSTGLSMNYAQGMSFDKNNNIGYLAAYTSGGALYSFSTTTGAATLIGPFQGSDELDAFAIPYTGGGGQPIQWGKTIYSITWTGTTIAPWTCKATVAGNYWNTADEIITNYPLYGKGLNDAMYTKIDLTDPTLYYAEFNFDTTWNIEKGVELYIEISPDWDGTSSMDSATWVSFWHTTGASTQGWINSRDLVQDDRFVLNEYLGSVIYLRFRFVTPGEGANKISTGGWQLANKQIIYKNQTITYTDTEPPVTNAYFDCTTGKLTLVATDYPLIKGTGVKATYYNIDGGAFTIYTSPITIPEGTHTVCFYSIDNAGNKEVQQCKTYTVDTTPPTVKIIVPEAGALYIFGSKIMNRILSDKTLCIGKVPIEATASDGAGSGVQMVVFTFNSGTSWDATAPYTAVFKGMCFGDLTITAKAIDKVGLVSAPDQIIVTDYSLGLF